jgi:hypothetical protein
MGGDWGTMGDDGGRWATTGQGQGGGGDDDHRRGTVTSPSPRRQLVVSSSARSRAASRFRVAKGPTNPLSLRRGLVLRWAGVGEARIASRRRHGPRTSEKSRRNWINKLSWRLSIRYRLDSARNPCAASALSFQLSVSGARKPYYD